jgi:hypothetical protein
MKTTGLFILLLLLHLYAPAQGVFTNNTNTAIEQVIQDIPNQLKNIRGEVLTEGQQTTDYESQVKIPGARSCVITRFSVAKKEAHCWKATLFESASFQEARGTYKELYSQIKNSIIRIQGEKPYILNGQYEMPQESKRYHSTVFVMLPSVGQMQKVKVELSLQQFSSGWKVSLLIYDQDRSNYEQLLAVE